MTYPKDAVKHVSVAGNVDKILESSDLVIYGSFLEEQSFPEILMKAMALGKPIVAPDLLNIKKHVYFFSFARFSMEMLCGVLTVLAISN